ncbi:MAG: cobalt-precorrin-5B (C(1))-methyltransferase CbiD, partial [Pseudomonadota bacterium]
SADFIVTVSVPGGAELTKKTWNPRLGIVGGISILGTTGIVRPFSCAAWIASIHRGVDVARAAGLPHVLGATGSTSEATAQDLLHLPEIACLDMGDFAGGLLKYLGKHPVPRLTIAGGFGKMTKLAQGALDLHSARSQVDFNLLAEKAARTGADPDRIAIANTAAEALSIAGPALAEIIAEDALKTVTKTLRDAEVAPDIMIVGRDGTLLARSGATP